jgi:acyl carrier protein
MPMSPDAPTASRVTEISTMAPKTREHIESWLVNKLSESAGLDPQDIDLALPCTAYGLDSLTGVMLVGDLERWLNVHLLPTLCWDMPSIDQLVRYLVNEQLVTSENRTTSGNEPDQEGTGGLRLNPETARQLLSHLDQLSNHDVEVMLYQLAA